MKLRSDKFALLILAQITTGEIEVAGMAFVSPSSFTTDKFSTGATGIGPATLPASSRGLRLTLVTTRWRSSYR